jgi:hypothetical protein
MKAFMFAGIFVKHNPEGRDTQVRYGTFIAYPEVTKEEVEKVIFNLSSVFPLISKGFSMEAFEYSLINPEIAPMNRENHEIEIQPATLEDEGTQTP